MWHLYLLSLVCCRFRLRPSECVWRMSQTHLWPLPPARERLLVARGVFAVLGVSAASHHELLLQRPETLLQTRLPTVRADSLLSRRVCRLLSRVAISVCVLENFGVCVCINGIFRSDYFLLFCEIALFFFPPTRILRLGYKIQAYYLYFKIINYQRTWLQIIVVVITVIIRKCLPIFVRIL